MIICIFGDSIAWGASDYEKGGWVERLKAYFLEQTDDVSVYNLGISGDTAAGVLARFEREAKTRIADIIVFAVGINDSQDHEATKEFEKNISELVERAKRITKRVTFVGLTKVDESKVNPIPWAPDFSYRNDRVKAYDGIIRSVCEKEKVQSIEMFDVLDASDLDDGVHPNSEGHRKMFERIKKEIAL